MSFYGWVSIQTGVYVVIVFVVVVVVGCCFHNQHLCYSLNPSEHRDPVVLLSSVAGLPISGSWACTLPRFQPRRGRKVATHRWLVS